MEIIRKILYITFFIISILFIVITLLAYIKPNLKARDDFYLWYPFHIRNITFSILFFLMGISLFKKRNSVLIQYYVFIVVWLLFHILGAILDISMLGFAYPGDILLYITIVLIFPLIPGVFIYKLSKRFNSP